MAITNSKSLSGDLGLNEGHGLRSVLVDVLLVGVGIVSVAAVRVCAVAVALDDARVGRRALEALRTGGEALSSTSSDVVRETSTVVWVAHEDSSLNSSESISGKSSSGATAKSIVHNLSTLGVSDKNNLCAWALLVVGGHGFDNGLGSLCSRAVVAGTATGGLAPAGRVIDGL